MVYYLCQVKKYQELVILRILSWRFMVEFLENLRLASVC